MTRNKFVEILKEYDYSNDMIEEIWDHCPDKENVEELAIRYSCEHMKPKLGILNKTREALKNRDISGVLSGLKELMQEHPEKKLTREEFNEAWKEYPDSLLDDLWKITVKKGGVTRPEMNIIMKSLDHESDGAQLARLIKSLGMDIKKENVGRELKTEDAWFKINKEQLN